MTRSLTLQFMDGTNESWNVADDVASDAVTALGRQDAAHGLRISDDVTIHVNMRLVCTVAVGAAEEGEPEIGLSAATEEPTSEPAAAEPTEDTRTVPELKEALTAAGVEFDSKAKKDDLLKLAQDNNL